VPGAEQRSAIDLDLASSLTFNCLGAIGAGETLDVTDYRWNVSPGYALRFLGDLTANADFLSLLSRTTVNGSQAGFRFDGAYTDVFATPELSTFALIGLGGVLLLAARRRIRA